MYRYVVNGGISAEIAPNKREWYFIDIPSPNVYEKKQDIYKDENFAYRFIYDNELQEPVILCFEKEITHKRNYGLEVQVQGDIIHKYTFNEWIKVGGKIYKENFEEIKITSFKDIYPMMEKNHLYYFDNEAYIIQQIDADGSFYYID